MDHMSKSWMCSTLPISTGTLKVLDSGELMPFSLGGLLAFLSFYYIAINRLYYVPSSVVIVEGKSDIE